MNDPTLLSLLIRKLYSGILAEEKGTNGWVTNAVEELLGKPLIGLNFLGHHDDHLRSYLSSPFLLQGLTLAVLSGPCQLLPL